MSWVYGHYKYFNSSSAATVFVRQYLRQSEDVEMVNSKDAYFFANITIFRRLKDIALAIPGSNECRTETNISIVQKMKWIGF